MPRKKLPVAHPVRHLDFVLIAMIIGIAALGAILIYSATSYATGDVSPFHSLRLQIVWIIIGLVAFALSASFDYQKLRTYSDVIYVVSVILLIVVLVLGRTVLGAQRWIPVGPFGLQPSELAKLGLIISLAAFLSRRKEGFAPPRDVGFALLYTAILLGLVMLQPDLGTALVFVAILVGILFASGVSLGYLAGLAGAGVVILPISMRLNIIKSYQIQRLLVFLRPGEDPSGSGYSLLQSKIAIGSGQLFGRGLFLGSQTRLNFIPHAPTDFIFAVLGEQLGFIGAALLITLFGVLLWRLVRVAQTARDLFGMLLVAGVLSMLTFQVFVNIGMTVGIMPITGIPLPLVSYGGSSMLTTMIGLGLALNVYIRRYGA